MTRQARCRRSGDTLCLCDTRTTPPEPREERPASKTSSMKQVYEKDSISLFGAVSMGTGVMIGAAVFALTGQVAEFAGALLPLAFLPVLGTDYALLGDAAGFADPLTGEGIHNALRSAALFAEAWRTGDVRRYVLRVRRAFAKEFAFARAIRRSVFESEIGVRLIRAGFSSDAGYSLVAAIVDAVNEHDGNVLRLTRRWSRTLRRVRADPSDARRAHRVPVPCGCGRASADTNTHWPRRTADTAG